MNMKWVLPIACVVTLAACQSGGMGKSNSSMGSSSSSPAATSSGTYSSGSSMGSSTSSDKANPNANPAAANPQPGEGQSKERGSNPALNTGPTTSGTTTK